MGLGDKSAENISDHRDDIECEHTKHDEEEYEDFEVEEHRLEFRKKIYFLFGSLASGIVPAAIAENANLLAMPLFSTPFLALVYLVSPDGYELDSLIIAAWILVIVGVISVSAL